MPLSMCSVVSHVCAHNCPLLLEDIFQRWIPKLCQVRACVLGCRSGTVVRIYLLLSRWEQHLEKHVHCFVAGKKEMVLLHLVSQELHLICFWNVRLYAFSDHLRVHSTVRATIDDLSYFTRALALACIHTCKNVWWWQIIFVFVTLLRTLFSSAVRFRVRSFATMSFEVLWLSLSRRVARIHFCDGNLQVHCG